MDSYPILEDTIKSYELYDDVMSDYLNNNIRNLEMLGKLLAFRRHVSGEKLNEIEKRIDNIVIFELNLQNFTTTSALRDEWYPAAKEIDDIFADKHNNYGIMTDYRDIAAAFIRIVSSW